MKTLKSAKKTSTKKLVKKTSENSKADGKLFYFILLFIIALLLVSVLLQCIGIYLDFQTNSKKPPGVASVTHSEGATVKESGPKILSEWDVVLIFCALLGGIAFVAETTYMILWAFGIIRNRNAN